MQRWSVFEDNWHPVKDDWGDYVLYADAKARIEELEAAPCKTCGSDPVVAEIGSKLGFRPDLAFLRIKKLEEENDRLKAERRQDALDGQAALDEANNEIIRLKAELAEAQGRKAVK